MHKVVSTQTGKVFDSVEEFQLEDLKRLREKYKDCKDARILFPCKIFGPLTPKTTHVEPQP